MNALKQHLSISGAYALGSLIVLLVLYFPTLREIALTSWNDDDYSHGLLLPLVAAYMIWDSREYFLETLRRGSPKDDFLLFPLILLCVGMFFFFLGQASGISFASWIAFFPTSIAVMHLIYGRTAAKLFAPPLLLLFMAKPLPDSLVVRLFWPLQVFAAKASKVTLELLDVPVYLTGNIIEIPSMKLMVEEACSGMRSVMSLLTLACIVIYFVKLHWTLRIVLVGISLGVAIALNIFRVALTGVLAHFYDPATATGFFHTFSGLIVFIIGLPLLYFSGVGLMKLEQKVRGTV